ncbi:site-specific integrase [Nitratidesulfovibrio sp. HK-II]|uniref:site-specific integrase n=1 Tax=Nitratidesulfovibrio sp. HK-II TaxID=2009266 RepID=UPI000E2F4852|nr:site-specific integrase [Nitratidesulfovibrio sp. HK-II]GBO97049.1 integrase [Nitratidesulfovibrio sp. HK-II]
MAAQRGYGKHLLLKAGIWYFRLALPADIRNRSGKREVRLSLRTGYARIASAYATSLDASKHKLFNIIRSDIMADLTPYEMKEYISAYFNKILESMWDDLLDKPHSSTDELEKTIQNVTQFKNQAKTNYALRNTQSAIKAVDEIITTNDLDIEKNSRDYTRMGVEALKVYVDVAEVLLLRLKGNHRDEENIMAAYATPQRQDTSDSNTKQKPTLLFDLINAYCTDRIERKLWKRRGLTESARKFDRLKRILGNVPVAGLDHTDATRARDIMLKLPLRLDAKRFQNKSIEELIALEGEARPSIKTINDQLIMASSLFEFAVTRREATVNIFKNTTIADDVSADRKRDPFTDDDLKQIFDISTYSTFCAGDSAKYWLPILGLFTGARLNELSQIRTVDVYEKSGILVIDITEEDEEQSVKLHHTCRIVPVHQTIIDLGFANYVQDVKDNGGNFIFPQLPYRNFRRSGKPSQYFSDYLATLGEFKKKSYHSFRHTFIMNLRNQGIMNEVIASATGHKGLDTGPIPQNYKQQHDPRLLMRDVISKLSFPVDFSAYPPCKKMTMD